MKGLKMLYPVTYYCMATHLYFGVECDFLPNRRLSKSNLYLVKFDDDNEYWVYPKIFKQVVTPNNAKIVDSDWDFVIGKLKENKLMFHQSCLDNGAIVVG
jgi:hypothetical protein